MDRKQQLLDKIAGRQALIGIVGLGYVGLPLAVAFAKEGFSVVGVDLDARKIESLKRGESYVEDIPSAELGPLVKEGRIRVSTDYAQLAAADAISGARPGARRESLETYIKRLERLESIAESKKGVEKSYAIQAGREIRVMVKPDEIDDDAASLLCREIAREIEQELDYPGQIRVIVIRESRAVDYAK